jgi:hypothetical protein
MSFGYREWTPQMLVMSVLYMGTDSSRQRLRQAYGWTDEDFAKIASALPESVLDDINRIWKIMGTGELTRRTQEVFKRINNYSLRLLPATPFTVTSSDGREVQMTGGYIPLRYIGRKGRLTEEDGFSPRYSDPSGTFKRADAVGGAPVPSLSLGTLVSDVADRSRYIAFRETLREIFSILNSRDVQKEYQETQGYERYDAMVELLRHVANPTLKRSKATTELERYAKSVMVSAALMGNLSSAVMQLTSITVGAGRVGAHLLTSLAHFAANPVGAMKEAREMSPLLKDRFNMQDVDLHSARNKFDQNLFEKVQEKFATVCYYPMRMMDTFVACVGFHAAYSKAMEEGHTEEEAISIGEEFVAQTQGSTRSIDAMTFQLGPMNIFTPFITAVAAQQNVAAHDLLDPESTGMAKVVNMLCDMLIPAILAALWRFIAAPPDDDRDSVMTNAEAAALRELISQPVAGIPIVRDIADLLGGKLTGQNRGNDIGAGYWRELWGLADTAYKSGKALTDADYDYATYLMADAVGRATMMPATTIYSKTARLFNNIAGMEIPTGKDFKGEGK